MENSREVIRTVLSADENYAVCLKEDNRAVGCVGLKTPTQTQEKASGTELEIGYWIGFPFWGNGYIPEAVRAIQRHAFEDLGCTALWCGYYDGNEKSKRCQEKCGFLYHHTEENKPCVLMGDIRTEHYSYLTKEHWKTLTEKRMFSLRPYQASDAEVILSWIRDEVSFRKWCADRYERYPITAEDMNRHYGECMKAGSFFPMTAVDESGIVGHMILRYLDEEKTILRFGFVIVDDKKRGLGYGRKMLRAAADYAFKELKVQKITLVVFENNPTAYRCYRSVGFIDSGEETVRYCRFFEEDWKCFEMELSRPHG